MSAIPCKRPKVAVEFHPMVGYNPDTGQHEGRHVVICKVPGCDFTRKYHVVKTGAQEEARWHRDTHKRAVPKTKVYQLPAGPNFEHRGYMAECACGWYRDAPGVTSRGDNEAALDYHLTHDHGLVTS